MITTETTAEERKRWAGADEFDPTSHWARLIRDVETLVAELSKREQMTMAVVSKAAETDRLSDENRSLRSLLKDVERELDRLEIEKEKSKDPT